MEYQFTTDWFTRHHGLWQVVLNTIRPSKILEIGCFEGRATTYMIEQCGDHHPLEIYAIDSFHGGVEHTGMDFNQVQSKFDSNCELATQKVLHPVKVIKLVGLSLEGLGRLAAEGIRNFDLTYVDASHIASDVFLDAAMAFQLTRVGGAIIFDDYGAPDEDNPYKFPKIAIEAFEKVHANKVRVMEFFTSNRTPIPADQLYQRYYWKISE